MSIKLMDWRSSRKSHSKIEFLIIIFKTTVSTSQTRTNIRKQENNQITNKSTNKITNVTVKSKDKIMDKNNKEINTKN